MVKKRRFGEFLKCLLNLELKVDELQGFLSKCNEIIPIRNLEVCTTLIANLRDESEIEYIQSKLPTKDQAKDGEFYKCNDGGGIGFRYADTMKGMIVSEETMGGTINDLLELLFENMESLKRSLESLIESMATCSSLPELNENATLRNLASDYPPLTIHMARNSIEKKPGGLKPWDLRIEYLRQCASYAFFEFFLENQNVDRIRHCSICSEFFIAEDLKRHRCYTPACHKEYERLKKQKQREDDPVKYF